MTAKSSLLAQTFLALLLFGGGSAAPANAENPTVSVSSPRANARIEFSLEPHEKTDAVPHYRVFYKNQPAILNSRLGIELAGEPGLGGPCVIESVHSAAHHHAYSMIPGKRRQVVDSCAETTVTLRERTAPNRRWELVLRAYDDGVAFRYRFPAQEGWPKLRLAAEHTEFALPADARAWTLPLNGFTTSYEVLYEKQEAKDIPATNLLGLPLLVECPGRCWLAITEANLTDYAGMYLARKKGAVMNSRLSPLPGNPKLAVEASLPHDSPWRVIMLGEQPGRLVESDLVLNLNEPCAIADTSWIKTGKTTFPWWNGYHEEKVDFKPGLNTATMKHYIDFCAEAGIPYHSLDGVEDKAWYSGPIVPYQGADITKAIDGLDLPEVIQHANLKGVRLRLWMHWQAAKAHMQRAFPLYRQWGIEGVMIDFMDRDDQEMVNFLRDLVRLAAENRLTVTLHGVSKPTGLERTYPNLLTHEGVRNLEYDKWDPIGIPPEHEVTIPFTRMLAGPLDFHQGSFRAVSVEQFKPRNVAPLVMGTPARTLASYVVFQNHLPMVADYPSAYRGHPGLPMLAKIPTTWDDTRVISGVVGEHVIIARRSGQDWYVGAMNDRRPRTLEARYDFLGEGSFQAEIYGDDPKAMGAQRLTSRVEIVTAKESVKLALDSAGGSMIWLTPVRVHHHPGS